MIGTTLDYRTVGNDDRKRVEGYFLEIRKDNKKTADDET